VDPIRANAKHSAHGIKLIFKRIAERLNGRSKPKVEKFVEHFKDLKTVSSATMCEEVSFAGMDIKGAPYKSNGKPCAFETCDKCGVEKFFKEKLEDVPISLEEEVEMSRFEPVVRSWGTVLELVKKTVPLREAMEMAKVDVKEYKKHSFKDWWVRRTSSLQLANQKPNQAHGKADFASGLSFCSIESITCSPDNYAYLEVFCVTIKRRTVGSVEIFTNLIFYYFGEADSKYKNNDVAAHEANELHMLNILKRDYGITDYVQQTDGCKAQFVNRQYAENVAAMFRKMGITMCAIVCEPACGKSQCDGASKRVTRLIQAGVKDGDYIPKGLEGWKKCRGVQPKKASLYKQWEDEEDCYNLEHVKGIFGEDVCHYYFNTNDGEEFAKLNKEFPGEIVRTRRDLTFVINPVKDITKNRFFVGTPEHELGYQDLPCHCLGCREEKDGTPNCLHDDVSGRSNRKVIKMTRTLGFVIKIVCTEERSDSEGHKYEKDVDRELVKADLIDGGLTYLNANCIQKNAKVRGLILFKDSDLGWGLGRVTTVLKNTVVVTVLVVKGGKGVLPAEFSVNNIDVKAIINCQPHQITVRVQFGDEILEDLEKLCV
jgi:hypothetical protein